MINEIAWMGTENSFNDEWIELYNNTDKHIDLEGWALKSRDKSPIINLSGSISLNSFFLLERTNDESFPDIAADIIYSGALKNTGEHLELYDNLGNLIDSLDFRSGWPAGDNETNQTMERAASGEWQTSQDPGGTPRAKNSIVLEGGDKEHERINKGLASISKSMSFGPLIIAFLLAICSGAIILTIKRKTA